ncbi:MAG: hypothetical protein H7X76_06495 [Prolixibacteraceae bacterium]|nr:hypothetical protein [Burkholderiales bacterium]
MSATRAFLELTFFALVAVVLAYLLLWMVGMRPSTRDMFNRLLWNADPIDDWRQMRKTPMRKKLLGTLMMLIAVAAATFALGALRVFLSQS